jgi:hypothetical protein
MESLSGSVSLALLAALVISGVATATANAEVSCAVVVEAGTGRYDDAKCETLGGSKEYIKVLLPGVLIAPNVLCAVVAEAGTGTYNDAKCETAGGSREYIKVIEPAGGEAPFWTVGGTRRWADDHVH